MLHKSPGDVKYEPVTTGLTNCQLYVQKIGFTMFEITLYWG